MFPRRSRHVPPPDPAATCSIPLHVPRQTPLERHVPPIPQMFPGRSRYCDMFRQTPLERHVPPTDPATATCSAPAGLARATCSPARPRYCDMFPADPATATCSTPADPARAHVPPPDPATATCSAPAGLARATCSPARPRYCDMFGPQVPLERHVPRQIPLERHVLERPQSCDMFPLERHVPPPDPATATCSTPTAPTCFAFAEGVEFVAEGRFGPALGVRGRVGSGVRPERRRTPNRNERWGGKACEVPRGARDLAQPDASLSRLARSAATCSVARPDLPLERHVPPPELPPLERHVRSGGPSQSSPR